MHGCSLSAHRFSLLITKGAGLPNIQIFQISHFLAFFTRGAFRKSYFKSVAVKNVNKTFYLILLKEESLETCFQVRYKYSYFCFHCSNFGACLMTELSSKVQKPSLEVWKSSSSVRYSRLVLFTISSRIILVHYCKCCNLIGYPTRYLFIIR